MNITKPAALLLAAGAMRTGRHPHDRRRRRQPGLGGSGRRTSPHRTARG
ncbi:hypothetical protein [Streptomyces canus]|uniref:Uncharacterized protein n=1 Tax=Streptomyces canus TaxID=58343 RepID=A0AAW8FEB6_9ACTN|nr:hypothetical protein [Streptomyces canus]MDQ0763358.1 hypothetical protein [Streptomyces canus]MDQ0908188.1 hypothetical protein [Streptomyces canus]